MKETVFLTKCPLADFLQVNNELCRSVLYYRATIPPSIHILEAV